MAIIKDWKLGDAPPPGYRLVRELHELPRAREAIVKTLTDILAKNVQRVLVEVQKPIVVLRLAKETEVGPVVEDTINDDLYDMVRNAPIEPIAFVPIAPVMHRLMDLLKRVTGSGMVPVAFLCGDDDAVAAWLSYPTEFLSHIMGIPVTVSTEVPGDVLLLACRLQHEAEGIDHSFKLTIDMPEAK